MKLIVKKTDRLVGSARIPGSKSHSVRALLFAALAEMQTGERSTFMGLLESDDTRAARAACAALLAGASELHTGNSGITTRFIMPMLGLRKNADQPITLDVDEQMRARPMEPLISALRELGMKIEPVNHVNGDDRHIKLPVRVSGRLRGGTVEVSGETSQYVSALLMSLPAAEGDSVITVRNLRERSYMEMMLGWLDFYGIRYEHNHSQASQDSQDGADELDEFRIQGGQTFVAKDRNIPGDFSSASYLIVAAALTNSEVCLQGLDMNDSQGDKAMVAILQNMGADITIDGNELLIRGGKPLRAIEVDCNLIPDMLPTLAVVATQAEGETRLFNVAHARIKETDRIHSMAEGLRAMGADIEEMEDGLVIRKSELHSARVHGYADHRTIMALAIASMLVEGKTEMLETKACGTVIDTAEGISKTFPTFVRLMQQLGADMRMAHDHIVLMGFKHAGKTTLGKSLAKAIGRPFVDLDDKIEELHGGSEKCREILQERGEKYFRDLEAKALEALLQTEPSVVALGGGAPMLTENQTMLRGELCVQITVDSDELLKRIEKHGWPAFADKENPQQSLRKLWAEREPVYKKLATITVQSQPEKADTLDALKVALAAHIPLNLIIGYPLEHTWTPRLHNAAYQDLGLNALMVAHQCEDINACVKKIRQLNAHLTVVTMPHKQSIMQYLDEVDEEARRIGAVNTVINRIGHDGSSKLTGYNTDVDGVAHALRNTQIAGKTVLILGAGGAARPAAYFVNRESGKLLCLNRSHEKAQALTEEFGGRAITQDELEDLHVDAIINATPLGMVPEEGKTPLPKSVLKPYHTVLDMIYNPAETQLLKFAHEVGAKTISGIEMFVGQGLKQIEIFAAMQNTAIQNFAGPPAHNPTSKKLDPNSYIKKLF